MDLANRFPRSPYDMNAGLIMLPRTADKASVNDAMRHRRPENEREREWFAAPQKRFGRTVYLTFFDNLDVDEERF